MIEDFVIANALLYSRLAEAEIVVEIEGQWGRYQATFVWQEHRQSLHFHCQIPVHISVAFKAELNALLADINPEVWVGHFEYANAKPDTSPPAGAILAEGYSGAVMKSGQPSKQSSKNPSVLVGGIESELLNPVFRYTALIQEQTLATSQIQDILHIALEVCDRFYPAFNTVVESASGGDVGSSTLLAGLMSETVGDA